MPKINRVAKRAAAEATPPRVRAAEKVADREERKLLLSAIMRDPGATGAEVTAAGRLLEGMERAAAGSETRGIPPPTNRPEQIARCVRVLTAAGTDITLAALEIIANRVETSRKVAFDNRASGRNPMGVPALMKYTRRIKGDKYEAPTEEQNGGEYPDSLGPITGSGGAAANGAGVPDVLELEEPSEQAAEPDELDGERDHSAEQEARGA